MTNRCALASHIGIIDFRNGDHDMGDAAVDEVNRLVFSRMGKPTLSRRSVGSVIRKDTKRLSIRRKSRRPVFQRNLWLLSADFVCEAREAARAVAAHLGFAAIGVIIAHPEICAVCWLFQ